MGIICTYFRSSSWNTWESCQQQFYLQYILGFSNEAGLAATKGNIVHKALECLAAYKLSLQNHSTSFIDDSLGMLHHEDCDPDNLIQLSYNWHREHYIDHVWDDKKDFRDCKNWMWKALSFQDGLFDPRNRKIVTPEQQFDFEIRKPWAEYSYKLPDGKRLEGYLSLKGTIDLITEVRPGIYEIIDWKTGATRKNFATGKDKDYESLHDDAQLRLYHYAAHQLFPKIDEIMMTIYYVRAGGPYSLMLSKDDLPKTEELIRKQFDWVRKTQKPLLNPGPEWSRKPKPWLAGYKCHKLCKFSKQSRFDPNKTECQFIRDKIYQIGIDKVTEKYADFEKINKYGSGGGRSGT